jgi:hypothetical protein
MRKVIALAAILAAGCTTMAAEEPAPGQPSGPTCSADGLDSFFGQPASQETGPRSCGDRVPRRCAGSRTTPR